MATKTNDIWATGRRKAATARIKLIKGSGQILVNGLKMEIYFPTSALQGLVKQPYAITGTAGQFDLKIKVHGGGKVGQAKAVRHGITRALLEVDPELRSVLKESGLITRDARVKERKKPGQPSARARFQFSKR